jgi:Mg-chelatase subunit ChlD
METTANPNVQAEIGPAPQPVNTQNLELNKGDDFIIGLDISASMQASDCPGGLTRSAYVLEQMRTFVKEASKWDTDGVSLYAFGTGVHAHPDVTADKLDETVDRLAKLPYEGATMTHLVVKKAWDEHKERNNEQTVLMLFTDGEPSDPEALLSNIASITNSVVDEREFNIAFITVGARSVGLEAFLAKLDDEIPGARYDIVDVKRLEEVDFYKAFDGALND